MGSSEGVTATAGSRLFDDCRAVLQRLGLLRDSEQHASSGGGAAPQDRPLGDSAKDVVAPLRPGQQAGKRDPPPGGGAAAGAAPAAGPHRDRRLTDQDPTPTGAHPDHQQWGDMQLDCEPHHAHARAGAAPPAPPLPPPLFLPPAADGGGTPPSSSAFARQAQHAFPPSDAASAPQQAAPPSAAPGPSVAPPATATGGLPPQQRGAQHSRSSSTSTSSWPSGSLGTSMPPPPSPAAAPAQPQPTDASTSSTAAAPPSLGAPSSSSWGSAHAPTSHAYPHSFPGTALAPTHGGGAGADASASSFALARTGSCVGLPLPKPQSHSLGGCPSWGSAHSSHRPSLAGDASSSSSLGQGQAQRPASAASSDPSLGHTNSLMAAASPAVPGRWPRPSASGCLSSPQQPPPSWPSFGRPSLLSPQHGGPPSPAPASARPRRPPAVPPLNLSLLPGSSGGAGAGCGQDGSPAPPRKLQRSWMHGGAGAEDEEDLQAELASYLAPPKWFPKSEGRWYVHKPITSQEVRQYEALVHSLPPAQAVQVAKLLQTLLSAQYSCELMASRGVRIAKDITSEWSRLTGGLLDRIEGYEQCLKKKAATQCSTCSRGMSPGQGAPQARQQAAPGRGSGAAAPGSTQQQQPRRTMCGAPSGRLQQPQLSREELCELYAQLSDAHAETSDALEVARGKYDLAARDVRDLRQDLEDAEACAWQQQQQLQGQFRQQLAQAQRDASQREARAAAAGAERAERLEKEVAALRALLAEQQGQQQGQQQGGGGGGAAIAGGRGKTPASPVALQQQQRLSQQHAGGVAAAAVGAGEVMVELAVSARGRPAGKAC